MLLVSPSWIYVDKNKRDNNMEDEGFHVKILNILKLSDMREVSILGGKYKNENK